VGRALWAALAVPAAIALAACSGGGGKATSTAKGQVAPIKAARTVADLSKALDINVPDGYVRQPDTVDDTGPSDLDKAVADDGADDARDALTRNRFVRGYQREWALDAKDEVVSYVYQFADPTGAEDYTKRIAAEAGSPAAGATTTMFNVAGIAGAVGVNSSAPTFATSSVTFMKGPYSVQVIVNGTSPVGLEAMVRSVAEEQYSRL
jgi:hypothetical protein